MKKIIDFNIKYRPQIESGEMKVETRDGHSVKILDWEADQNVFPIIFSWKTNVGDEPSHATINGRQKVNGSGHPLDLFLVTEEPEPELTEFEEAIQNMMRPYVDLPVDIIRRNANDLLKLAKKKIFNESTGWYLYWGDGKVTYEGYPCMVEEKAK